MTKLFVWGSSHCKTTRFFPEYFLELINRQKRFNIPKIYAKGGQTLTQTLQRTIIDTIWDNKCPQTHILILGDNDIRSSKSVESVVERFKVILEKAARQKNCFILVSGIISGIQLDKFKRDSLFRLNQELRTLCKNYINGQTRFANINHKLKKDKYVPDKVHLNRQGAQLLAATLYRSLIAFPKVVPSLRKCPNI